MKVFLDEIQLTDKENKHCFGFKYILTSDDGTKKAISKVSCLQAERNFKKTHKITEEINIYLRNRTKQILEK